MGHPVHEIFCVDSMKVSVLQMFVMKSNRFSARFLPNNSCMNIMLVK